MLWDLSIAWGVKVRCLLDRPLVEQNSYTYNRAVLLPPTRSIEEKLKDLIHGKPDLVRDKKDDIQYNIEFPLKLLLAFLEDLDGLRMDTKYLFGSAEAAFHIYVSVFFFFFWAHVWGAKRLPFMHCLWTVTVTLD